MRYASLPAAVVLVASAFAGCSDRVTVISTLSGSSPAPNVTRIDPGPDARKRAQTAMIEAKPGDVIEFAAGRFDFDATLSLDVSGVTVRGQGPGKTVLSFKDQGPGTGGEGLLLTGKEHITVQDLAVEDARGDAIKANGVKGLTLRNLKTSWSGGPKPTNGGYGLYPVLCTDLLIEECTATDASDAGIYVGQSRNVVVHHNTATKNVAGIEIENTTDADVNGNIATDNAGGILVFTMPDLPVKEGRNCRVFGNRVVANNHENFAPKGNTVASVPPGTGLMVLANDRVEVFDNTIENNQTAGLSVVSYTIMGLEIKDAKYDPFPEAVHVHDNRFKDNGGKPAGKLGEELVKLLGAPLPDILYDGVTDPKASAAAAPVLRLRNNPGARFANFDAGSLNQPGKAPNVVRDLKPYEGELPALPAVKLAGEVRMGRTLPGSAAAIPLLPSPLAGEGPEVKGVPAGARGEDPLTPTLSRKGRGGQTASAAALVLLALLGCSARTTPEPPPRPRAGAAPATARPPRKLSEFGLFKGNPADQRPAEGVIPYDLNSALFSDYALKYRFVKLPEGAAARYSETGPFDFPVGTVIAKTFAYPADARDPSRGRRLIETRILKRDPDGWVGLPYVWDDAQADAVLDVAGGTADVSWAHTDGKVRKNNYIIPNTNQCKGCHKAGDVTMPIGPKARHLNRDFAYAHGTENQLAYWSRAGALEGAPAPGKAPRLAAWDDPESGPLEARARAWLEINCAHCHSPDGPARNSGLDLLASQKDPTSFGVMKPPVAAGLGSGGLRFDVVPGRPDESILAYRIASTHPGVMMPELGKRLVHDEGVALVRGWIAAMPAPAGGR